MATHELYSASAVAANSITMQKMFNAPSTLSFREAVKYDATSTFSLQDTVTYTDPDAGLFFKGILINKSRVGAGMEYQQWKARDIVIRQLDRTIYRHSTGSSFVYNKIETEASSLLSVKEVLQEVLTAAVSAISSLDAYSLPSATTADLPETRFSGQTYKDVIDALFNFLPNWGYYTAYGASGTATFTVVDFVAGGASQTVTIGDGTDATLSATRNVISINLSDGAENKFKTITAEGLGTFEERYRVQMSPAWDLSATGTVTTADILWSASSAITDLFMVENYETGEWEPYRAPCIVYYISASTVCLQATLEPSEYGQDPVDLRTNNKVLSTTAFTNAGYSYSTATASNFYISYTARTADFKKQITASSTALDGEKIWQNDDWCKYTIVQRWNISATSTVVYNTTATMSSLLGDFSDVWQTLGKSGGVITFKYGDIPFELGDKITNLDNLRVGAIKLNPDRRECTLNLTNDLQSLPVNYYLQRKRRGKELSKS